MGLPARVEIVPGGDVVAQVQRHLAPGTTVTITCLPHHGPEETVQLAGELAALGYRAVPHLAARTIGSRQQLAEFAARLGGAGVRDVFVIAGDSRETAGPYAWSLPLLEDLAEIGGFDTGFAAYPEGHPTIAEPELTELLLRKQEFGSWAVTQMCFSGEVLTDYVGRIRADGVTVPVWAGVPGRVRRTRLLALAGRIGVGPSLKFAQRSGSLLRSVLAPSSYDPSPLVRSVERSSGFAGLHVYSFNDFGRGNPPVSPLSR